MNKTKVKEMNAPHTSPYISKDGRPCATIEERDYFNARIERASLCESLHKKLLYVSMLQEIEIPRLKAENTRLIKKLQELNESIKQYMSKEEPRHE